METALDQAIRRAMKLACRVGTPLLRPDGQWSAQVWSEEGIETSGLRAG
jgi:hypothetical protein